LISGGFRSFCGWVSREHSAGTSTGKLRKAVALFNLGLLAIYVTIFFQLREPLRDGYSDFIAFYSAGMILERGTPSRLYDLQLQYQIQREIAPNIQIRQAALPFVRPAFEAWIFRPLTHLSYGTAFLLWDLLGCGCVIVSLLILRQEITGFHGIPASLVIATGLCYFPVFFMLVQGQDSFLLLLIYVLAFRALRRDRQLLCGLILGFGVFKFPLILPFLVPLALRRRLRVVWGFLLTSVSLAAISLATVGLPAAEEYPKYLLSVNSLVKRINRAQDMPNLRGLFGLLPRTMLSAELGGILLVLFSIALLGYVVRKSSFNRWDRDSSLALALNVVATVLVSYHCHAFDLCILILPLGLGVDFIRSNLLIEPRVRWQLIAMLWLVAFSPLYLLATYTLGTPSLLAILLLGFAFAIGVTLSELRKDQPALMVSTARTE